MANSHEDSTANTLASEAHALGPSTPAKSLVERFMQVRGIESRPKPVNRLPMATVSRIPPRPLWHGYTKRHFGERIDFVRRAMKMPDETFSDSVDVYNPKKRPTRFLKVHEEAEEISEQFLYRARCLFFEREVVDRPVCDLFENRAQYEADLCQVYDLEDIDLESETSDTPNASAPDPHLS